MPENKKMKILFISLYDYDSFSIRTLQSFIKSKGYDTETIFFKNKIFSHLSEPTKNEINLLINKIKGINPDIICISVRSSFSNIVIKISNLIKKYMPDSIIIWGGTHATICPEECIKYSDFVCVGEGELSLLEFIQNIEKNKSVDNIPNFWIKKENKIIKNELRPLIQDLDKLPLPDYSKENKYYIDNNELNSGDPILESNKYHIMASRGCPFKCSFCSNSYLHNLFHGKGNYIRKRSVESVIKELILAKEVFKNLKIIFFLDEVFPSDKDWINKFAEEYKHKIGIDFWCEFHPSVINEDTIKILKSAGLKEVITGIQTGSQRVRYSIFKRYISDEQIINTSRILKKYSIIPTYDIILDNPYETEKDMKQSIEMLLKIPRPYNISLFSLINLPKTELTERLIKDGIIEKDNSVKALTNFKMNLKLIKSKNHLYYNCLVSLLSKRFIPKIIIKNFPKKHLNLLVTFTKICNKTKIGISGIKYLLLGKIPYKTLKYYVRNRKELMNGVN